jgi:hypothetical protein
MTGIRQAARAAYPLAAGLQLILAKEAVLTASRALEFALFMDAKLDMSKVAANNEPSSQNM